MWKLVCVGDLVSILGKGELNIHSYNACDSDIKHIHIAMTEIFKATHMIQSE